jgi:hypothetical protein
MSSSDEQLSFPDYGLFTVTRTLSGCSASFTFVVLETEHVDSIVVYPAEVTLPIGETQVFDICPINQFGAPIDTCQEVFVATQLGDTTLAFECHDMQVTASAHVLAYANLNLALDKPVTVSGYENAGTVPENATDGKMDTRWGSRHQDNEWIEVDLLHCYLLDSIRLYWETAHATSYEVFVSEDAETYRSVYSTTSCTGGTNSIPLTDISGRYIRLVGYARNTGYGISLYEIEVYGSGSCSSGQTGMEELYIPSDSYKFIRNGQLYIMYKGTMYDVQGQKVN